MALTPEEQKNLNDLQKKQNELLEEGYGLSTSYVESLKEVLGIRTRISTGESNVLNLNRQINKAILTQKTDLSTIDGLQKQIAKNQNLLNQSAVLQGNLEKVANINRVNVAAQELSHLNELQDRREKLETKLQNQNNLSKTEVSLIKNLINNIDNEVSLREKNISRLEETLTSTDKQYLYTRLQNTELEKQNKLRQAELEYLKQREKSLGTTGKLTKALSEIPGLGKLLGSPEYMKEVNARVDAVYQKTGKFPGLWRTFGIQIAAIGKSLATAFTDPLTLITFGIGGIIKAVKFFFDLMVGADKATADLAKGMNMSYTSASGLRKQFADIKDSAHSSYVSIQGLQESQLAIAKTLGTTSVLNRQDLITFTKLRDQAGYTNEELIEMQRLTLATGGNLEDNVKSFAGTVAKLNLQNKLTVNEKQLLKDVSNVSDRIKLSVGGTADSIAKAAFKAKQFGINLEQADKISEGLLNFEESMEAQISAELLTGKQLNLERARLLALNNDIAGASAEILSQVGSAAEYGDMNRIQQEAIAKAIGLSKDELAKSLVEREALQRIGVKDAKAAEEKYRILRKTMTAEEAAKALNDEAYARQFEQNAITEDFNKLVLQLKEAFIPLAQALLPKIKTLLKDSGPLVEKIKDFIQNVTSSVNAIITGFKILGVVIGAISILKLAKGISDVVTGIGQGVSKAKELGQSLKEAVIKPSKPITPETPKAGETGPADQASKIGKLNAADMLKGAAALLVVAAALYVAAKAFQEFAKVNWEDVGKGIAGITGLALTTKLLAKGSTDMIKGAAALAILGASLIPAAYGFKQFTDVKWETLAIAGTAIAGLATLAAVAGMPPIVGFIEAGAFALGSLGLALLPLAAAVRIATPGIEALGNVISKAFTGIASIIKESSDGISKIFTTLGKINVGKLILLGPALFSISTGLAALGAGGAIGGIGNAISRAFGGGPIKLLNEFSKLGQPLNLVAVSIQNVASSLSQFATSLNKISPDKLEALNKFKGPSGGGLENITEVLSLGVSNIKTTLSAYGKQFLSYLGIEDGMISPEGGLIVAGKKGTYQLDKKDTVVAGTELGKTGVSKVGDAKISPKGEKAMTTGKGTFTTVSPSPTINVLLPKTEAPIETAKANASIVTSEISKQLVDRTNQISSSISSTNASISKSLIDSATQTKSEISSSSALINKSLVNSTNQIKSDISSNISSITASTNTLTNTLANTTTKQLTDSTNQIKSESVSTNNNVIKLLSDITNQIKSEVSSSVSFVSATVKQLVDNTSKIKSEVLSSITSTNTKSTEQLTNTSKQVQTESASTNTSITKLLSNITSQIKSDTLSSISSVSTTIKQLVDSTSKIKSDVLSSITSTNTKSTQQLTDTSKQVQLESSKVNTTITKSISDKTSQIKSDISNVSKTTSNELATSSKQIQSNVSTTSKDISSVNSNVVKQLTNSTNQIKSDVSSNAISTNAEVTKQLVNTSNNIKATSLSTSDFVSKQLLDRSNQIKSDVTSISTSEFAKLNKVQQEILTRSTSISKAETPEKAISPTINVTIPAVGSAPVISRENIRAVETTLNKIETEKTKPVEVNVDIESLIKEQQRTNQILNRLLNKEGYVYIDSVKSGTSNNMGTYKIQ